MSGGLFGPDLWSKLEANPESASLLEDPSFKTILDQLRANPASLSAHISDPRVLKLFTILSKQSGDAAAAAASTTDPAQAAATTVVEEEGGAPSPGRTVNSPMPDAAAAEARPQEPPREKTDAERAVDEKSRGTEAYKRRDFDTAVEAYTAALALDPDNMSLFTNRAAAKLEAGDVDGCIADCRQAIEENSTRVLRTDFKIIARAYARMGNAYLRKKDYGTAMAMFEKSLLEFSDPKVKVTLNDVRRLKKKAEEEAYIDPEISKKVRAEGNELFLAGKFPESIAKYSDAIKRNPQDASPYSNRAAAYMKLAEFPMAMKDCDRCLEIDPKFVKAYIRKGNIHFFMKEFHKCLEVFEKGLKLAPNNKELQAGLMKTNMKIQTQQDSGEVDEAQMQQAMKDPEIQQILQDPQMNTLLKQMQEDPKFAAKAMQDPSVSAKVQKLIASGFLRVG